MSLDPNNHNVGYGENAFTRCPESHFDLRLDRGGSQIVINTTNAVDNAQLNAIEIH